MICYIYLNDLFNILQQKQKFCVIFYGYRATVLYYYFYFIIINISLNFTNELSDAFIKNVRDKIKILPLECSKFQ